jgi:hypothetical protein
VSDPSAGQVELPESPDPSATEQEAGATQPPAAVSDQPDGTAEAAPSESGRDDRSQPAGAVPEVESPIAPPAGPTPGSSDFRMALVSAVTVDLPTQHPTVVLREIESPRRQLSFSIALPDGVMLSHALRRIRTPRPITHELLSSIIQGFDIDVVAVRLVGRKGAVYFAELDLRGKDGRAVYSCRPSDALTVALLQPVPVPILIDRRLFEEVGDVTPPGPPAPKA